MLERLLLEEPLDDLDLPPQRPVNPTTCLAGCVLLVEDPPETLLESLSDVLRSELARLSFLPRKLRLLSGDVDVTASSAVVCAARLSAWGLALVPRASWRSKSRCPSLDTCLSDLGGDRDDCAVLHVLWGLVALPGLEPRAAKSCCLRTACSAGEKDRLMPFCSLISSRRAAAYCLLDNPSFSSCCT